MRLILYSLIFLVVFSFDCQSQSGKSEKIIPGAARFEKYLPQLEGKSVAVVVNQTSRVGDQHLVDALLERDINIHHIFSPEHGFRGEAGAGEKVEDAVDPETGIDIISLYGSNRKPKPEHITPIDVVIFDIQDVGTRFYTYISTMHNVMEACAEQEKKMIILDRPNPNGFYVDGPVREEGFESFVGKHPIPIVHGLTVGELAIMINGEHWLPDGMQCEIEVVKTKNYTHAKRYDLPVRPSPNLPNERAINLYPSLCLFEGTMISVGRGTPFPFQVIGYPDPAFGKKQKGVDNIRFTPEIIPNAAPDPKLKGKKCYGYDFRNHGEWEGINLKYLIQYYQTAKKLGMEDDFFTGYFNTLAGTSQLKEQIKGGLTAEEIKISWQPALNDYKAMRKNYLLYEDFE